MSVDCNTCAMHQTTMDGTRLVCKYERMFVKMFQKFFHNHGMRVTLGSCEHYKAGAK